ncbi:hypothetical protein PPYR_02839 [Photinus pyralis]|uniref:N-acetylglucosaminylphosphatidylinositol deacetylase n=1 Tax=Photinus pyralis TaxID=7054 RepID=A0A5N4A164_PHOPY|nr:N-acetylglucosaminyl-phosphatidylinositol de-N-acetylase [Photinus pyralis]KAB0791039.1 hypothetical protein PPYR_02839 [Photinus pyralis]
MQNELAVHLSDSWSAILSTTTTLCSDQFENLSDYTRNASKQFLLAFLIYCTLCVSIYIATFKWKWPLFASDFDEPKRILIVTAHPDDECMFFGPTILNVVRNRKSLVYLMCLSTGANYGMGRTRKRELYDACDILGIEHGHIIIRNHSNLPDAQGARWPTELLSRMILDQIERYDIDTLVTFDKYGISRHINHCSIYYAIAYLSIEKNLPKDCKVYVLETINVLRKYSLIFEIPFSYLLSRRRFILSYADRNVLVSAMRKHKSQMVWFRYLYLTFSRYFIINTLQEMDLEDIELELAVDD